MHSTSRPDAGGALAPLLRLAPEWDALATRAGAPPYLRPGWVAAWWHAFGEGQLEVRALRRGERLAAVLPVARVGDALRSTANIHTPASEVLAEDEGAAAELVATLFADKAPRVSIESLERSGAGLRACQRAAEAMGYRYVVRPWQHSPYLDIDGDWDAYEAQRSRGLLADVRRSRRRLARLGTLHVEVCDGSEDLEQHLAEAFAVEASGWKGLGRTAIRCHADTAAFYTDVARWAAARKLLRLYFLRLGRRSIAVYYALVERGTCHLLKGGYDAEFRRCSPGKVLMHEVIARAFLERLARVDFHGDAEPYKLAWAGGVRDHLRFEAFSRAPIAQLAWATQAHARPAAARVLRTLGLRKERAAT